VERGEYQLYCWFAGAWAGVGRNYIVLEKPMTNPYIGEGQFPDHLRVFGEEKTSFSIFGSKSHQTWNEGSRHYMEQS